MGLGVLIVAFLGGTAYVLTRKSDGTSDEARPSRFAGQLRKGQLYRIWLRTEPKYIEWWRLNAPAGTSSQKAMEDDIRSRVEKSGFTGTLLVTQDPTAATTWQVLTRWGQSSTECFDRAPLTYFQLQAVEEPPAAVLAPPPTIPDSLDRGLTQVELDAVQYALAKEMNPKHLGGFASTLEPEFPTAASYLRAKSSLAILRQSGSMVIGKVNERGYAQRKKLAGQMVTIGWFGEDAVDWVGDRAEDVGDALSKLPVVEQLIQITKDMGEWMTGAWEQFGGIAYILPGGSWVWLAETAFLIAKDIEDGKPVFGVMGQRVTDQGKRFAHGLKATSPFVAMIPGLGTGIAMMMNASAALALGQDLSEAAIETIALALPGGAVIQQTFKAAANFGNAIREGKGIDTAFLEAARKQLPEQAQIAFDAGLALARGKSLQDAGFAALYQFCKGNDIATRAAQFSESAVKAAQAGKPLKDFLVDEMSGDLRRAAGNVFDRAMEDVQRVASELVKNATRAVGTEDLLKLTPSELAQRMRTTIEVAQAAMATIRDLGDGVRVVDQGVIRRLDPMGALVTKYSERSNSATALMSALRIDPLAATVTDLETARAKLQTITSLAALAPPATLGRRIVDSSEVRPPMHPCDALESAKQMGQGVAIINALAQKCRDNPKVLVPSPEQAAIDASRAKEELQRANRALDRQKWVMWYRRLIDAEKGSNTALQQGMLTGRIQ